MKCKVNQSKVKWKLKIDEVEIDESEMNLKWNQMQTKSNDMQIKMKCKLN